MGVGDERARGKNTAPMDHKELEKLAKHSVRAPTDPGADSRVAKGSERAVRADQARPTSKLAAEDIVGLLGADARADEVISLEEQDKKTQRMRAKHFQELLRGGAQVTLPISNQTLSSIDWKSDEPRSEPLIARGSSPVPRERLTTPAAKRPVVAMQPIEKPAGQDEVIELVPKPLSRDPDTSLSTRTMHRFEAEEAEADPKRQRAANAWFGISLFVLAVAAIITVFLLRN
jgi:hypothetical protein